MSYMTVASLDDLPNRMDPETGDSGYEVDGPMEGWECAYQDDEVGLVVGTIGRVTEWDVTDRGMCTAEEVTISLCDLSMAMTDEESIAEVRIEELLDPPKDWSAYDAHWGGLYDEREKDDVEGLPSYEEWKNTTEGEKR